jgi:hypothetical protein
MPNLGGIVRELKAQRDRAQKEVERLNAALTALGNLGNGHGRSNRGLAARKRKPMSAAARRKIAAAQHARWAKWKKNKQHN